MPIYADSRDRLIVDALEQPTASKDWHPANATATKLWQCLEALRDIDLALESAGQQGDATKRKRLMKQFSVPLHSLAKCVVRLCDQIVGDPDASVELPPGTTAQVAKMKADLLVLVPIDHKGDLSVLRDRLGGHIDAKLSPRSAEEILAREAVSSFGKWLHVCIHVLLDLLKLDVYWWSVPAEIPGTIKLMTNEPFLITFEVSEDKQLKNLVGLDLSTRSPRQTMVEVIDKIVKESQWMFKPGERRIRTLKSDQRDAWNTFSEGRRIWAASSRGGAL